MKNKIINIEPLGFPWKTKDPFLFCAHHRDDYPEGNENLGIDSKYLKGRDIGQDFTIKDGFRMYHGEKIPGFPYHPHRGFETITINNEGFVDHSDSMGASGRFGSGDVQWMTAGKGIQHSEMFPLLNKDKGNPLEILQIWLNLPKINKMVDPHFKMLWNDEIPKVIEKDNNGNKTIIELIAGGYKDYNAPKPTPDSWAADKQNGICILNIKMDHKAKWKLPPANSDLNRSLYFYQGNLLEIEGKKLNDYHLIELKPDAEIEIINQGTNAQLLLLQGKPINEPTVQYGPFVMNTREEIQQTFEDYRKTQFGGWPWAEKEQIHMNIKGRFAIHSDGTEEYK